MSIDRSYKFILVFLLLCVGFSVLAQTGRPNILLILTDDLGINDVGCYGNAFYETPNIDRLCEEGMKFNHHYSAGAVCSPTRTAIITGKFPARTNSTEVYNWGIDNEYFNEPLLCEKDKVLEKDQTFLAEVIRDQGYATAMFGKWHIEGVVPKETGFDESMVNHNSTQKDQDANKDEFHIEEITNLTEKFIEASIEKKRPFFVVTSHHSIHVPQSASTESRVYFEEKAALPEWQNRPELQTPVYAGMMKDLDDGVGRLLTKIDQLEIAENTIVIFTSDNGGLADRNFPHRGEKADQYEGGIRVPFIVRWPKKVKAGSSSSEVIVSNDYYRTLAGILGAKVHEKAAPDSEDFSATLFEQPKAKRAPIVFHFPHYRGKDGKAWMRPWSVVRSGDYTYIYHWEAELTPGLATGKYASHALYNVVKDPAQKENLINREKELAASLKAYLLTWLKENGAQIPKVNPKFVVPENVDFNDIQVGAIRWDAWHRKERGDIVQQVEYALSPKKYQWRAPFFTQILSDTAIDIKGYDQQVIDQEIKYASDMGLDYWAFLLYDEHTGLNDGLKYYLSSDHKDDVKFCAMLNPSRLFGSSKEDNKAEEGIERLIRYFKESSYLMVEDNRPVIYFFRPDGDWVENYGGEEEIKKRMSSLQDASVEAGFGEPYIVVMHYKQDTGKAMARLLDADAFSAYATYGDDGVSGQTYDNLTRQTEAFWNGYLNQDRQVIPTVMTGWDRRPRIERPMSWETGWQQPGVGMEKYFELPTNKQLTDHFKRAAHWLHQNSLRNHPKMLLVYAWNEHDEGGWLTPTIKDDGSANTERLEILKAMLK
ncbi:MAG: sulfatase-like hydrolase/transferase [Cyclobacteriaceae bacterium]